MRRKKFLILINILVIIFFYNTSKVNAESDTNSNHNDYTINKYEINMEVKENNEYDITETITAYFNQPKHGIVRKIPLKNTIIRTDGTKTNNKAQIRNINISESYISSYENGYKIIQIGDANKNIIGSHTYTIKYTYDIGKDPLKNIDEMYFNLVGEQWDTTINNISFQITMPKKFDKSLLNFSNGINGSTNNSNINYSVNGNIISGTLSNTLKPGQALTVRLTLPEGYFIREQFKLDKFSILVIIISLLFTFIAYILWAKYGKDAQVIETVEFYPPEGYNSAEAGFLYQGTATNKSVISLLIYLANKGYLKIEETEEKIRYSESKGFKITKLKEYDGNNEYEKIFFKGIFGGRISVSLSINKAKEIMKEAKIQGEKISYEDALELVIDTGISRKSVTANDLYDNFYMIIDIIKSKLNSKENKNKIYEKAVSGKRKWLILMNVVIYILITIKPVLEYSEYKIITLLLALIFPSIGFIVLYKMITGKSESTVYVNGKPINSSFAPKIFNLIWGTVFSVVPWSIFVLPFLLENTFYLLTYIVGILCIILILTFNNIMPKRTKYGNEILGKLKGFKRFLETAEKEQLESLVMKNPEYFYNILPYTYALGVSDVWVKKFETISMEAPPWCEIHNNYSVISIGEFITFAMDTASTSISSNGGNETSINGGNVSGGGSGGGGGSSW